MFVTVYFGCGQSRYGREMADFGSLPVWLPMIALSAHCICTFWRFWRSVQVKQSAEMRTALLHPTYSDRR